jgi:hypothetical protein
MRQSCSPKEDHPVFQGKYLGQDPPGTEGQLFVPGIMLTGLDELNAVFFPDGKWTEPEVASFSGKYGGVDPFVSFDGNRVYFCSNRPREKREAAKEDYDIWYVDRTESGWSAPICMGSPINTEYKATLSCLHSGMEKILGGRPTFTSVFRGMMDRGLSF